MSLVDDVRFSFYFFLFGSNGIDEGCDSGDADK
jgi:hypothetical protein